MHAHAEVKLPRILGSNMVLQRNQPIKIWGWASAGEKISIEFLGNSISVKVPKNGKWQVLLPGQAAGGPYKMTITGAENTIVLSNLLIGDVWVCSGQSNMEWRMKSVNKADQEINNANYDRIRLFTVSKEIALQPLDDLSGGEWMECTPENVGMFSAVGYFFGRNLHEKLEVPIGMVSSAWGGTNIEAWMSHDAITTVKGFENIQELKNNKNLEAKARELEKYYTAMMDNFGKTLGGLVDGKAIWADLELDTSTWKNMTVPSFWEEKGLEGLNGGCLVP